MVKNLEPHREGKEPKITIPPRLHGSTVTLKNTTGMNVDGLLVRLEEPAPAKVKKKKTENENKSASKHEADFDEDVDEDDDNGGQVKPAREYVTEIEFQATIHTNENQAKGANTALVRRPEVMVQFAPVSDGEVFDLDVTLLNPPALEEEAGFALIPTRNSNVVLEAKTVSSFRPRLAAYVSLFVLGEFLALIPLIIPASTIVLGGLTLLPVLVGLNIIGLVVLAVWLDKFIPKPQFKVRIRHLVILVLTALLIALMISGKSLTDAVFSQYLLVYGLTLAVYLASLAVESYTKARVKNKPSQLRVS